MSGGSGKLTSPGVEPVLPDNLDLVRTTDEFDEHTVPPGLLKAHRTASGVWGNLTVRSGSLDFAFEDDANSLRSVETGGSQPIPPGRPHRVILTGPTKFAVEFYRSDSSAV